MTISTTTNRVSYSGNGSTTVFSFPYFFLANADLTVILVSAAGVETTQMLTTHYTLTGAGVGAGGTVTMLVAPPTGASLVILNDPDITQLNDYVENDQLPAETGLEQPLDRLTIIAQRLNSLISRSMRFSDGDISGASVVLPTPTATQLLGWNATATGLDNYGAADIDLTLVSAFIQTLFDDSNAAAARTTLGAVGLTGNETIAGNKTLTGTLALSGAQFREAKGADIASATTVDLSAATGNLVHITGTTTTTAVTLTSGAKVRCIADGAWPLTYHATNLKLNTGGVSYTCTAGDRIEFSYDGTTTFGNITKQDGTALAVATVSSITLGTPQATTSGTTKDFTISASAKRITVNFNRVSTNGTSDYLVQIGVGSVTTSGYISSGTTNGTTTSSSTIGFILSASAAAAASVSGSMIISLTDSTNHIYEAISQLARSDGNSCTGVGDVTLSGAMTIVRITTVGGDTFDSGSVNVSSEL